MLLLLLYVCSLLFCLSHFGHPNYKDSYFLQFLTQQRDNLCDYPSVLHLYLLLDYSIFFQ